MDRSRGLGCLGLLVLAAIPVSIPGLQTTSYGGWPVVGIAVALLVVGGRAWRWWLLLALTAVLGVALTLSYAVPLWLGLVGSLSVTVPALISWQVLTRGGREPLELLAAQGRRYHLGTALAALASGCSAALTVSGIQDLQGVLLTGLMSFLASLTAQLAVLPLLMAPGRRRRVAGRGELVLQRLLLVGLAVLVFAPPSGVVEAFILLPALAWSAIRARAREAHLQLFLVCVTAYAFTFAGFGELTPEGGYLPPALAPAMLYLFVAAACYLVVPLTLTVEHLSQMTAQATRAATTVERLIDSASLTLFIATDATGHITHFNSGAARTLGYDAEEVLGRSPEMFHTPEEIARQAQHFGVPASHTAVALAQAASEHRRDWAFRCRDGQERMVSLSLSEVTDPRGRITGYIAAGEDITERLRTQESMSAALAREHAAVVRLQEVDHVTQELVSNVSHELRTPITSIAGYAELLADEELGELNRAQREAIDRIERNSSRLGVLVEDLLTMSRAESGRLQLTLVPLDLREVAGEAAEMVHELVRLRDLTVRVDLPDQPVRLLGDRDALERVASNLLTNAIKFTPDGGQVVLTVVGRTGDGTAELAVSDTGIGISEKDQEHLFTRFYRAASATEHAIQGTGLGLSIVHAIVSEHGGTVGVQSSPNRGTVVTVRLPRGEGWEPEPPRESAPQERRRLRRT